MRRALVNVLIVLVSLPISFDAIAQSAAPSDADVRAARNALRSSYQEFYSAARSPLDLDILSRRLMKHGQNAASSVERYAALDEARLTAAAGGGVVMMSRVLDAMLENFDVDKWKLWEESVRECGRARMLPVQSFHFVAEILPVLDRAIYEGEFDAANTIVAVLTAAAKKSRDAGLVARTGQRRTDLREIDRKRAEADRAIKALSADATDSDANLIAGTFLCFFQGNWEDGLPLLAKSGDAELSALAQESLNATPGRQLPQADTWWDLGDKKRGVASRRISDRAALIYRKLVTDLSGEQLARAEKRINEALRGVRPTYRERDQVSVKRVFALFKLNPEEWVITNDILSGSVGNVPPDNTVRFLTPIPSNSRSFHFGYRVRSRQYQMVTVESGRNRYLYSRGHWQNSGALFNDPDTNRARGQELVEEPDKWHFIEVTFESGRLTFFYDGVPVRQTVPKAPPAGTPLMAGFGSYKTSIEIRDMFFTTSR